MSLYTNAIRLANHLYTAYLMLQNVSSYPYASRKETFCDLTAYAVKEGLAGEKAILYGEIPGISYFLDMPAAISTSWPDLVSKNKTAQKKMPL